MSAWRRWPVLFQLERHRRFGRDAGGWRRHKCLLTDAAGGAEKRSCGGETILSSAIASLVVVASSSRRRGAADNESCGFGQSNNKRSNRRIPLPFPSVIIVNNSCLIALVHTFRSASRSRTTTSGAHGGMVGKVVLFSLFENTEPIPPHRTGPLLLLPPDDIRSGPCLARSVVAWGRDGCPIQPACKASLLSSCSSIDASPAAVRSAHALHCVRRDSAGEHVVAGREEPWRLRC